jgi:hypothetical protein
MAGRRMQLDTLNIIKKTTKKLFLQLNWMPVELGSVIICMNRAQQKNTDENNRHDPGPICRNPLPCQINAGTWEEDRDPPYL